MQSEEVTGTEEAKTGATKMKISKSKQELARIISGNGGWCDGVEWAIQNGDHGRISFSENKPSRHGSKSWMAEGGFQFKIEVCKPISNWHQTILSRAEYLHLYPAPDADGWIECNGLAPEIGSDVVVDVKFMDGGNYCAGIRRVIDWRWDCAGIGSDIIAYRLHKPEQVKSTAVGDDETNVAGKEELEAMECRESPEQREKLAKIYAPSIEQLASDYRNRKDYADRKQEEADAAKADAEAKLADLVAAGKALGLVISVTEEEHELVITDWSDLQLGDIIEYVDGDIKDKIGMTGPVVEFEPNARDSLYVRLRCDNGKNKGRFGWPRKWRFIRRP